MSRREFRGRSAAEAAIHACEELGVSRSDLRYEVLSEHGEGLERIVVIAVEVDPNASGRSSADEGDDEPRRSRDDDRGHGRMRERRDDDRGHGRSRRGGRRDRGDRGDRGGRRDRGDRGGQRMGRGGHGHSDRDRDDDGIEALLNLEGAAPDYTPRAAFSGEASSVAERAMTSLEEVVRLMGLALELVRVDETEDEVEIDLRGSDAEKVVGRKGEGILALQFLLNRMVTRDSEDSKRVIIDAGGYRERRRNALADLAKKLAGRALEEGKVVRLSPMTAHDRRIFHITLKEMEGVSTRSEGNGLYRRLLIIPEDEQA